MNDGIEIQELKKSFRGMTRPALGGVTLSMAPGSITGIIGPNGAGKTTLMGCLLGLLLPDEGVISIDGHSPRDPQIRRRFGYVPERLTFDRWMKAADFVSFHHALAGLPKASRKADVERAFERVGLPPESMKKPVRQFSRGMLQRLGLAQATLGEPGFIFLDEPTSGMDPAGVLLFKALVREKAAQGALVVLNSHQLNQVEELCDHVYFIKEGLVASQLDASAAQASASFVLRWPTGEASSKAELGAIAKKAKAELLSYHKGKLEARFATPGDTQRAALVAAALKAGLPISEAYADSQGLESLFEEAR